MISFIIPTRNNLPYLKLAYKSVRYWNPDAEILILDDNSDDGTQDWLWALKETDANLKVNTHQGKQVGHTVLYDEGIKVAKNDIFTIFHADMVCGPKYAENLLKHLKRGTVVAATRIEPPLHPPGKEKIIHDWGMYPGDLDDGIYDDKGASKLGKFYKFCLDEGTKPENENKTSKGIFAPWAMYKDDFLAIGGHDKLFAPFPYEDSDIFQRMILKGYDIVQSRDAFVYHFTCRGHRWTKEIKKDDSFYKLCCAKNMSHYLRKWGAWIENDENCYPVIQNKYDVGFVVTGCTPNLLGILEPWCNTIYTDLDVKPIIDNLQPGTPFDLTQRIKPISSNQDNGVLVKFDAKQLTQENFVVITNLAKILKDTGQEGEFELGMFSFSIKGLETYQDGLVNTEEAYYKNQLKPVDPADPYSLRTLFEVYEKVSKTP